VNFLEMIVLPWKRAGDTGRRCEMSAAKLTPWFPESMKPVHVGVYETIRELHGSHFFSKWDGKQWLIDCDKPEQAESKRGRSAFQGRKWRGVLK